MGVTVVCDSCGDEHQISDRTFEPDSGTTSCPNCGERPYTVRRDGIRWHPE